MPKGYKHAKRVVIVPTYLELQLGTAQRDYCPFTRVARESRTSAIVLANIALTADTYAEMKQLLRKHDTVIGPPCNFARFVEPDCEVFEQAKGEWIPMRHLHNLASSFLDKHC